jgi:hypothetical protein
MKLVIAAALVALLGLPSLAAADDGRLRPPGGDVYDEDVGEPGPQAEQRPRGHGKQRGKRMRRAMIARFDANGDGRLQPQERKQAKRAIREKRRQRFIQRFDTNRDGNVGPGEVPPEAAKRLRRLDRNGDGWVQPNETR